MGGGGGVLVKINGVLFLRGLIRGWYSNADYIFQRLFQIFGAKQKSVFWPWLLFCEVWLSLEKYTIVLVLGLSACLKTPIYTGLLLLKILKVVEMMHCLNWPLIGSQLVFSNLSSWLWVLLFKFKQKHMPLFWSVCNFVFIFLFKLNTKLNTHIQNGFELLH